MAVDWTLVRRLHEATATALAEELKRRPTLSTVAQEELARTLVQDGVDELVRQRMRAGQVGPTPAEEQVIAEAVFAAQFGLGRLQPYVDDTLVENIEAHESRLTPPPAPVGAPTTTFGGSRVR